MKLYHFTHEWVKIRLLERYFLAEGEISALKGERDHPHVVGTEHWSKFANNPKRKWYCYEDSLCTMSDIPLWEKSGELGRLIYYLEERERGMYREREIVLASFETNLNDNIWVCEAEHLRKYHLGESDELTSHLNFAESRIPLSDYRGQFKLPEYRVGNLVPLDRITWEEVPKIELIELKTKKPTTQMFSEF